MPRPPVKRRRQNSFGNSFALRKQARAPRIPDQTQAREAHDKSLAKKPVGKRPADSDDSDELITSKHGARGGRRRKQDIYASGAVAKGDKPGAWPTRAQRTRSMREDTEEILSQQSRSRTASRANSVSSSAENAVQQPGVKTIPQLPKAGQTQKALLEKVTQPPRPARSLVNGISSTPQPEASILGKIKPRKRQASILQLIENGESNSEDSFASDDLTGFSPDGISTPIDKPLLIASTPLKSTTPFLKRKRDDDDDAIGAVSAASHSKRIQLPGAQPTLPSLSRSQQKRLDRSASTAADPAENIMALPESSDEDMDVAPQPMPRKIINQRTSKHKTVVPSTEQLQTLMPSKKHNIDRIRRGQGTEFNLATETDEEPLSDDDNDISTFAPSRQRKPAKRTATNPKPKQRKGIKGKSKALSGTKSKAKDKLKSTNTIPNSQTLTPSPVRLRTPRPLMSSSSKLRESLAKSPIKQVVNQNPDSRNVMGDKSTNSAVPMTGTNTKKQYGGCRSTRRGVAAGKENQGAADMSSDGSLQPDEDVEAMRKTVQHVQTVDGRAWRKKWADIDDFSLDFEEVTASTRSSSPMAR